jgi:hypothetical protein
VADSLIQHVNIFSNPMHVFALHFASFSAPSSPALSLPCANSKSPFLQAETMPTRLMSIHTRSPAEEAGTEEYVDVMAVDDNGDPLFP